MSEKSAGAHIAEAIAALDMGAPSREASLAKTKLQEAQFWAGESEKKAAGA